MQKRKDAKKIAERNAEEMQERLYGAWADWVVYCSTCRKENAKDSLERIMGKA